MRNFKNIQLQITTPPIFQIELNVNSRDEVPQLLMGLQYIYSNKILYFQIMERMEKALPRSISKKKGRLAMDWWEILVLGLLRLNCRWDYDKLEDQANHHQGIRKALMLEEWENRKYKRSTINQNLLLFHSSFFDEINTLIVKEARSQLAPKQREEIKARCDSFVVETNIHYPTDINLLWDAIRSVVKGLAESCKQLHISGWRQHKHLLKQFKNQLRRIQKMKHSTSKDLEKQEKKSEQIRQAHAKYLEMSEALLVRVKNTVILCQETLSGSGFVFSEEVFSRRIEQAERMMGLIKRRVMQEEKIPHDDKLFSIFEEHSEWIVKGKSGVSQELGLNVAIVSDQHGFLLHHQVMQKQKDSKLAVEIVEKSKNKFPQMTQCSFDKGYWSSSNFEAMSQNLENVILPKKGKRNQVEQERESQASFKQARNKHSAIESSIAALENHGLDRCRDKGEEGFKRYVALAVLARNIQILGSLLQKKERKKMQKLKLKVA